jgi:hypothetical protein
VNLFERPPKVFAAQVANAVVAALRERGLDCARKGSYYDVSPIIHDEVLRHARIALEAQAEQLRKK